MADGTLAAQGAVATLNDADLFYCDDGPGVDGKVTGTVLKAYTSNAPTLVTPDLGVPSAGDISACTGTLTSITLVTPALGTPASGDISACTSTNMALVTPDLGVPSAIDITAATGTVTSLTLVTPALGVVASGNIAACTGVSVELAAAIAGNSVGITATTGGGTTGLIVATAEHVSVTTDSGDKQISLPAAVAGKRIRITGPTNGCELISVVAGDKVNTVVVGATNEAALVAGSLYTLEYDGVDNWIMTGTDALGAVETPVVPDSLA